jgi:antitoxin (DNA-binding transcriptional repressor) of toxin-antitoxin stability system
LIKMAKAEARRRFSELTTRVGRRGERAKITHYGKTLAILVSKQDFQKLDECERATERATVNGDDVRAGRAARLPARRPSTNGDRGRQRR